MKILNTLRFLPIFIIMAFQPPNTNEVIIGQTIQPLQPRAVYPFTLLPNVVPSDAVFVFVSTIIQELNDKSVVVPLFKLQKTYDDIQYEYFNRTYQTAALLGDPNPMSEVTNPLQLIKIPQLSNNNELVIAAGAYAIGEFLEDQGSLPDITTAVEKAHEYVKIIESYTNEIPPNYSWTDYFGAISSGSMSFLRSNGLKGYQHIRFIRKRFFDQFPIAMP